MELASGVLLDTHVWLWLQNHELTPKGELAALLSEAGTANAIFVCSISMYEMAYAVRKGRLQLRPSPKDWFQIAFQGRSVRVLDITPAVAIETLNLPTKFHGDPGDRVIAATAITENLTLITHDKTLLRFGKQGLMRVFKVDKDKKANV